MSLTETENRRIQTIETKINDLQTTLSNLATRKELLNLFAILDTKISALQPEAVDIDEVTTEVTQNLQVVIDNLATRKEVKNLFAILTNNDSSTTVDTDDITDTVTTNLQSVLDNLATRKEVKNLFALLNSTLIQIREDLEQLELTGAGSALANHIVSDDHTSYHTDSRALTWLGTRSTSDLSEGNNLYYTEARVTANAAVQSGILHVHDRSHEMDSIADHQAASATNYGKYVRANPVDGKIEFSTIEGGSSDHGGLTGLLDDDHTQYYNAARLAADPLVQSGIIEVHNRSHEMDSIADHTSAYVANWGKFVKASPTDGKIQFSNIAQDDLSDTVITSPSSGHLLGYDGSNWTNKTITRSIGVSIDGGGSAITSGGTYYGQIPYNCVITGWTLVADQSGSIVIDVRKDSFNNFPPQADDTITGSEKPTLSSQQKNSDNNLTTWNTTINEGDWIAFVVESASTIEYATLAIQVRVL